MKKKLLAFIIIILAIRTCFIFGEVKVCVLPFTTKNEETDQSYALTDGIARLLVGELKNTKRINAVDYDIMVAYLYESYMDTDYKSLATNTTLAIDMLSEVFGVKYIITGSVDTFSSSTHRGKEKASVVYTIQIIDVLLKESIAEITVSDTKEKAFKGKLIKSDGAYFYETALGIATKQSLSKAAKEIVYNLNYPKLRSFVIRVENKTIYLNVGSENKVSVGDILNVYNVNIILGKENPEIIETKTIDNTENGEKKIIRYKSDMLRRYLFSKEELSYVGMCKITKVYKNYSIAEVYSIDKNTDHAEKTSQSKNELQENPQSENNKQVAKTFDPKLLMIAISQEDFAENKIDKD